MARKKRNKEAAGPAPVVEETAAAEPKPAKRKPRKRKQIAPPPGLPRFKSHKTVEAFKIHSIDSMTNGRWKLCGLDYFAIVESAYIDKHQPRVGGYYVRYDDGYESWSPAAAFEEGYTPA